MTWQGATILERELRPRGSRTELARALGKDPASITRWIAGARPDPSLWPAIEQHLGLAPGALGDSVSSPVDERLDRIEARLETMADDLGRTTATLAELAVQVGIALEILKRTTHPGRKNTARTTTPARR